MSGAEHKQRGSVQKIDRTCFELREPDALPRAARWCRYLAGRLAFCSATPLGVGPGGQTATCQRCAPAAGEGTRQGDEQRDVDRAERVGGLVLVLVADVLAEGEMKQRGSAA